MALVHYEVAYHLAADPEKKAKVIRLLTSEDEASVVEYLIKQHGSGNVVLRYAFLEPKPMCHEKTCGFCGHTRTIQTHEHRAWPPKEMMDESLWRVLV